MQYWSGRSCYHCGCELDPVVLDRSDEIEIELRIVLNTIRLKSGKAWDTADYDSLIAHAEVCEKTLLPLLRERSNIPCANCGKPIESATNSERVIERIVAAFAQMRDIARATSVQKGGK